MKYIDLAQNPAYQLWLATNAWQRMVRKALEPFDVTHCQFVILAAVDTIREEGEIATQVAVHRFAAIDENMTSQVVKTLITKGLLNRDRHPTDGRGHMLSLTEEGAKLVAEVREVIRPAKDAFFAPLGEEISELTRLLGKLNEG
jgi:DNA-binding MarR family transcriptional regulator